MRDWIRQVFFGALAGAVIGALLGLGLARMLWPPGPAPALPPASPQPTATQPVRPTWTPAATGTIPQNHEDLLVLVSALYALDGDSDRAQQRLAAAGVADAAGQASELAQRYAAEGNRRLATDLATLASALGAGDTELLAYVATATPTAPSTATRTATSTPTSSATRAASATPSPSPEPTLSVTPSPSPTAPKATRRPATATVVPAPVASPRPLVWDERVDRLDPPVKLVEAEAAPGEPYWRLVRQAWRRAVDGGNMLLYINVLDEAGQPVWGQAVIIENGGHAVMHTTPKEGESYGLNFVMSGTLGSYQAFVAGPLPSDRVVGLGLGERFGWTEHSTFVLEFQRTTR